MSGRVYLGDSIVVSDQLMDGETPVDLTGAEVVLILLAEGGDTITGPATVDNAPEGRVSYSGGIATTAGIFNGRWQVTKSGVVTSYPAPVLRIINPECEWATPADVAAIVGPSSDTDAVYAAIDAAQALLSAHFCQPVECPVPAAIRWATSVIAGHIITRPDPNGAQPVVAETIGDYSYRYAPPTETQVADLIREVRSMVWPWLCGWAKSSGTIASPRVWPDGADVLPCGDWALPLYQPDAEGLMRS